MIREIPWSPDVGARLMHHASRECLPFLAREVQAGAAQLWECSDGDDSLTVITRLDSNPTEWVMCYVQGSGLRKFAPQFVELARQRGWPLRAHTTDRRVVRMLRRHGFRLGEFVLRCSHGSLQ